MASLNPLPDLRRIVTAHNAEGKPIVQSDSVISSSPIAGLEHLRSGPVWITEETPSKDNNNDVDGATRTPTRGMIMPNGTNLRYTDLAPGTASPMHRTSSLDYNILVQGQIVLIMEDGSERHLKNSGDAVVQKGTMHAWRNPSETEWCRMVTAIVDAEPAVVGPNKNRLEDYWPASGT